MCVHCDPPHAFVCDPPPSFLPPGGSSSTFAIRHFAGDVVYDIYSLLNANADTIADDIVATFNTKVCGRVCGRVYTSLCRSVTLGLLLTCLLWSSTETCTVSASTILCSVCVCVRVRANLPLCVCVCVCVCAGDGTPKGQMCRLTPAYLQHSPYVTLRVTTCVLILYWRLIIQ